MYEIIQVQSECLDRVQELVYQHIRHRFFLYRILEKRADMGSKIIVARSANSRHDAFAQDYALRREGADAIDDQLCQI